MENLKQKINKILTLLTLQSKITKFMLKEINLAQIMNYLMIVSKMIVNQVLAQKKRQIR